MEETTPAPSKSKGSNSWTWIWSEQLWPRLLVVCLGCMLFPWIERIMSDYRLQIRDFFVVDREITYNVHSPHVHTHTQAYLNINSCELTNINSCIPSHKLTNILTQTHTCARIPSHTHTCIHEHTFTHTYIL
jgi:hypothetical protein